MDWVKVFKALGHELRFSIVELLLQGNIKSCCDEIHSYEQGCCVTDLTERFEIPQSTISHHMSILADSGIIHLEKRGIWSVYLLSQDTLIQLRDTIGNWISQVES